LLGEEEKMADRAKTRQELAYASLRADILTGRLKPGEKLRFNDLCANYGVSVGVMREALSRLVEQGLVQSAPQQGFSVTPISRTDLAELTSARLEIETLTLRHAIAEGDLAWESEVLGAEHRLAGTKLFASDHPLRFNEEWTARHSTFHENLLLGCSNGRLRAIASQLRAEAELYRNWSLSLSHGEDRDIVGEHRAIVEAVLSRDADLAAQRLSDHISLTTSLLLAAAEQSDAHELS
jgi:DNA-binding GntR family transcriptional regulator